MLFLLPFCLGWLLLPALSRFAAYHTLQNTMEQLVDNFGDRQQALHDSIQHVLPQLHYDCSDDDIRLLRSPEVQNIYIRVIGIVTRDGERCSSLGQTVPPPRLISDDPSDGFHLTSTQPVRNSHGELVLLYNQHGNRVYWILNSGWTAAAIHARCNQCLYSLSQHQPSGMRVPQGDPTIPTEPRAQRLRFADAKSGVVFELWSGEKLQAYWYRTLLGWWFPASLLSALLLAGLYRYWLLRATALPRRLARSLLREEFVPFYQPVVDARLGAVVGYEALIRWREGGRHLVSPAEFIDYAEDSQQILPMTEQLLARVLQDLPHLPEHTWVSINVSAIHVEGPYLQQLLARHQWPTPARICFELTERKPIQNMTQAREQLSALQDKGYEFKLDDFGTGYGGFAYLQRLGIQQIKIDKMFVDHLTEEGNQTLLHGIISFGHQTGMQMIAEGVETPEQVRLLAALGVDLIQGYVFARPMPLDELLAWQCPGADTVDTV